MHLACSLYWSCSPPCPSPLIALPSGRPISWPQHRSDWHQSLLHNQTRSDAGATDVAVGGGEAHDPYSPSLSARRAAQACCPRRARAWRPNDGALEAATSLCTHPGSLSLRGVLPHGGLTPLRGLIPLKGLIPLEGLIPLRGLLPHGGFPS